jgi:hypothetical protein
VTKGRAKTVHLGQFTRGHADAIAGQLEAAGIVWWFKQPGYLSSLWEKGVRLFVDEERLVESQEIARRILTGEKDPAAEKDKGGPG